MVDELSEEGLPRVGGPGRRPLVAHFVCEVGKQVQRPVQIRGRPDRVRPNSRPKVRSWMDACAFRRSRSAFAMP